MPCHHSTPPLLPPHPPSLRLRRPSHPSLRRRSHSTLAPHSQVVSALWYPPLCYLKPCAPNDFPPSKAFVFLSCLLSFCIGLYNPRRLPPTAYPLLITAHTSKITAHCKCFPLRASSVCAPVRCTSSYLNVICSLVLRCRATSSFLLMKHTPSFISRCLATRGAQQLQLQPEANVGMTWALNHHSFVSV